MYNHVKQTHQLIHIKIQDKKFGVFNAIPASYSTDQLSVGTFDSPHHTT
jgi:hypothetical protein